MCFNSFHCSSTSSSSQVLIIFKIILFPTADLFSVLRQLTPSWLDGKPPGLSLSTLRGQFERLVAKMCVQELTHSLSVKLVTRVALLERVAILCPQAKSNLHKHSSCLVADCFLPSFLSSPWHHEPMHRHPLMYYSEMNMQLFRQQHVRIGYQKSLSPLGQAHIWTEVENLQCCMLLECPCERV